MSDEDYQGGGGKKNTRCKTRSRGTGIYARNGEKDSENTIEHKKHKEEKGTSSETWDSYRTVNAN